MGQHPENRSDKHGKRINRVRSRSGRLGHLIKECLDNWEWLEEKFLSKIEKGCYAFRLQPVGHGEEFRVKVLAEKENIILYGVYGYNSKKGTDRQIGYCFIYLKNPFVHDHTWYCAVCYSDPEAISQKDWRVIYTDDQVRLTQIGIGQFEYLFAYRRKTDYHDEQGYSDGAVRLETADNWKDGL